MTRKKKPLRTRAIFDFRIRRDARRNLSRKPYRNVNGTETRPISIIDFGISVQIFPM